MKEKLEPREAKISLNLNTVVEKSWLRLQWFHGAVLRGLIPSSHMCVLFVLDLYSE